MSPFNFSKLRAVAALVMLSSFVFSPGLRAGKEIRSLDAIPTPANKGTAQSDLSREGYSLAQVPQDVPETVVDKAVRDIFSAWNTPGLQQKLSKNLPNRERLLDAVQSGVPRHIKLDILAVQNPRTLEQWLRPHPAGDGSIQVITKVSVRVRCQIASSRSLVRDFKRLEGTSEYIISIKQRVWPQ